MTHAKIIAAFALVLVLGFGAWATTQHPPDERPPSSAGLPSLTSVPDFTLVDQLGRTVKRADLLGHPVVLDFVFTSCTEFCSDMTDKMVKVRAALGDRSDVRLVSMSVDPEHDTPAVLRKYAVEHHANNPKWLFLTGNRATIGRIAQSMYLAPSGDPAQINPGLHSKRLVLIDPQGRVRGFYDYEDVDARQRLVGDARSLEWASPH